MNYKAILWIFLSMVLNVIIVVRKHWVHMVGLIVGFSIGWFLFSVGAIYYSDFIEWKPVTGMDFY